MILFLTADSKPLGGGAAEYLHGLCEALGRVGQPVTVCSTIPGCDSTAARHYAVRALEPRPRELGHRPGDGFFLTRKLNTAAYLLRLKRLAQAELPRLLASSATVIIHYWPGIGHFWCRACRELDVPYYILCHGLELAHPSSGLGRRWRTSDLSGAKGIIVSQENGRSLVRRAAGRDLACAVVHPGIDPASQRQASSQTLEARRKKLRLPQDARVVVSIGRLVKLKGFDRAIDAVGALSARFPNLYYLIAGEGPEDAALKDQAARTPAPERIVFLGGVSEEEKWILLSLCDVFVTPNRRLVGIDGHGFGIVFLEAGLAGKPVIGGDNGGVPDAIAHEGTGLLVDSEKPEALQGAISWLIENPEKAQEMGRAGRERALREFNWDRIAGGFLDYLAGH